MYKYVLFYTAKGKTVFFLFNKVKKSLFQLKQQLKMAPFSRQDDNFFLKVHQTNPIVISFLKPPCICIDALLQELLKMKLSSGKLQV